MVVAGARLFISGQQALLFVALRCHEGEERTINFHVSGTT